jgi:hypothetical protein
MKTMVRDATMTCGARSAAKRRDLGIIAIIAGSIAITCAIAWARGPGKLGACCLVDEPCQQLTELECMNAHGIWHGEGSDCAAVECEPPGACCIPFGTCVTATIIDCFGPLGGVVWAPNQSCGTFTCPPLGACCFPDESCQITLQSTCTVLLGGEYQGNSVACEDVTCGEGNPADFNNDGVVGPADLGTLLAAWGPCINCPASDCIADIAPEEGDCAVGAADLGQLLSRWGS